jgi:GNAT superfamily N-acetyltransferase
VRLAPDDAELAADVGAIVANAFDLGDLAGPWLARLVEDPHWAVFAALDKGRAVATGSLYRQGAAGWIDWDATSRGSRGRGLQRALLAARAAHADAEGLLRLHTCTGIAVPGDPQHSYHNILFAGFEETVARDNLVRTA